MTHGVTMTRVTLLPHHSVIVIWTTSPWHVKILI